MNHSFSSNFDKNPEHFPIKQEFIYLNNCGIAPLFRQAALASARFMDTHCRRGAAVFQEYGNPLDDLHTEAAKLMETNPQNISFMKNTAEALSLIANGYPFQPGDEIISYVHEYPSNHYPWKMQEKRGVKLKLLGNVSVCDLKENPNPGGWSMEELKKSITPKTRIVALSHVQFTSGFAADLTELGELCLANGIDLIIDTAQSLGSLPVLPEKMHISACAGSGWKWLLGPIGSGIMYTSEKFRKSLEVSAAGADIMEQGQNYLNHSWNPHTDGRRFEYSTIEVANAVALTQCFRLIFNHYGPENIKKEIFRLQDLFLEHIDPKKFSSALPETKNRSGILSLLPVKKDDALPSRALSSGLFVGMRGGYLRIAPHIYNDDVEIIKAAAILNSI